MSQAAEIDIPEADESVLDAIWDQIGRERGVAKALKADDHYDPSERRDGGGRWTAGGGGGARSDAGASPQPIDPSMVFDKPYAPQFKVGATGHNVAEAVKAYKSRGVEAVFAGHSRIAEEYGEKESKNYIAEADLIDDKVYINEKNPFWDDPAKAMAKMGKAGAASSSKPDHVIESEAARIYVMHKYGLAWARRLEQGHLSSENQKLAGDQVSTRAATSPKAYVSEVYAGLKAGKTYGPEATAVYKKFGGPDPSEAPGLGGPHTDPEAAPRKLKALPPLKTTTYSPGDKAGNVEKAARMLTDSGVPSITRGGAKEIARDKGSAWGAVNVIAGYHPLRDKILFNENNPDWDNPAKSSKAAYAFGHTSTGHPDHNVTHELGHARQRAELGLRETLRLHESKFSDTEKSLVKKEVSGYAGSNPNEFTAEVFAGLRTGKTYSPAVMGLYKKYKGPSL
jgi:hypothetical protein